MDEGATDKGAGYVAKGANHRSPELTTCKARTASRYIVHGRMHSARVSQYFAYGDEKAKRNCKPQAQNSIESSSEARSSNRGKHSFPWQRVMIEPTSCPIKFN